jgi:hypothetical protein
VTSLPRLVAGGRLKTLFHEMKSEDVHLISRYLITILFKSTFWVQSHCQDNNVARAIFDLTFGVCLFLLHIQMINCSTLKVKTSRLHPPPRSPRLSPRISLDLPLSIVSVHPSLLRRLSSYLATLPLYLGPSPRSPPVIVEILSRRA